jgi:putative ubiquitin-RnfH superfamily antitoxin RatB of RatAB toxin-antitoxin module
MLEFITGSNNNRLEDLIRAYHLAYGMGINESNDHLKRMIKSDLVNTIEILDELFADYKQIIQEGKALSQKYSAREWGRFHRLMSLVRLIEHHDAMKQLEQKVNKFGLSVKSARTAFNKGIENRNQVKELRKMIVDPEICQDDKKRGWLNAELDAVESRL